MADNWQGVDMKYVKPPGSDGPYPCTNVLFMCHPLMLTSSPQHDTVRALVVFFQKKFNFLCTGVLPTCMSVWRCQILESQTGLSCRVGAEAGSSEEQSVSAPNRWAISAAPWLSLLKDSVPPAVRTGGCVARPGRKGQDYQALWVVASLSSCVTVQTQHLYLSCIL